MLFQTLHYTSEWYSDEEYLIHFIYFFVSDFKSF